MNKFKNKLYKFMYGRYGIDELYKIGLIVCLLLSFLNIFINSRVVTIVEFILLIILIIRSLSKNIIKRKYENSIYLNLKKKIKNKFKLLKNRVRDRKTHIYRKCPVCATVLRLPMKKGEHTCKCPVCNKKFKVRCKYGT